MAWTESSKGENRGAGLASNAYKVLTETVTLGAAKGSRYSSSFSVPPGVGFTIISNTAATNLSGSASDQIYVSYDNSTFYQLKDTLRDCNYADDTNQGTSYRSVDNATRIRYVDPEYVGQFPYWKVRILQAAVESSSKTVALAVMIGDRLKNAYK